MKKQIISAMVVAAAVVGMSLIGGGPANAAGCATGSPQIWKVYNQNCSWAKHYDVISGSTYVYAPSAGPHSWSTQSACWANVTSYGAIKSNVAVPWA